MRANKAAETQTCAARGISGVKPRSSPMESASDCHLAKTFCHRHLVAQWLGDHLGIEVLNFWPAKP